MQIVTLQKFPTIWYVHVSLSCWSGLQKRDQLICMLRSSILPSEVRIGVIMYLSALPTAVDRLTCDNLLIKSQRSVHWIMTCLNRPYGNSLSYNVKHTE